MLKQKTWLWSHNGASNRLLFHVKASFDAPIYLVKNSIEQP